MPIVSNSFVYDLILAENVDCPSIPCWFPEQYSQTGEDIIVLGLLRAVARMNVDIDLHALKYVEIGANHPIATSSTLLLHRLLGMNGVLVEANKDLISDLQRVRPHDQVVHVAISDLDQEEVDFYISNQSELSSLDPGFVEEWKDGSVGTKEVHRVACMSINRLMEEYVGDQELAYLSIDIEGKDLDILKTLDFAAWKPWIVQMEPSEQYQPGSTGFMTDFMSEQGYMLISQTDVNLIFVDSSMVLKYLFRGAAGDSSDQLHHVERVIVEVEKEVVVEKPVEIEKQVIVEVEKEVVVEKPVEVVKLVNVGSGAQTWPSPVHSSVRARLLETLHNNDQLVVSFDVFDTLLTRKYMEPIDVFRHIEQHYDADGFCEERVRAERDSRVHKMKAAGTVEVTLDDIYEEIDKRFRSLRDVEVQCEISSVEPIPELLELHNHCISSGYRVIAVSDMYLGSHVVKEMLEATGYSGLQEVYVSSDIGLSKASGELFDHVLTDLGVDSGNVIHIGDNYHSDVSMAEQKGIKAFHVAHEHDEQRGFHVNPALLQKLSERGGLSASAVSKTLLSYSRVASDKDYWKYFGYVYAGPVLYSFCEAIKQYCDDNDIGRVVFMARDGEVMKKVFDMLSELDTRYMYVSRRMCYIASLEEVNDDSLEYLLSGPVGMKASEYITRLQIEGEAELLNRLSTYIDVDRPIVSADDRSKIKEFFIGASDVLLASAARENAALKQYADEVGLMDEVPTVIVDLGWQASSQRRLESVLDTSINGYYFGLFPWAYQNGRMQGFFFNYEDDVDNRNIVLDSVEVTELLFAGTHHSASKVQDGEVVFMQHDQQEDARMAVAQKIQDGVCEFTRDYMAVGVPEHVGKAVAGDVLGSLIRWPTSHDVEHIGNIPHNKYFGGSSYQSIIPAKEQLGQPGVENYWSIGTRVKYEGELKLPSRSLGVTKVKYIVDFVKAHGVSDTLKFAYSKRAKILHWLRN